MFTLVELEGDLPSYRRGWIALQEITTNDGHILLEALVLIQVS